MSIALSDVIFLVEYNSSSSFVCWKDDDVIILLQRIQCCNLVSCLVWFWCLCFANDRAEISTIVSASSVGIPAKTVSILATWSTAGIVVGVIE